MFMSKHHHVVAAAQAAAKNFHNGITGLAGAMGKGANILSNKLNPNCDKNHLTLVEAAELTELTQSPKIVDTLAALIGRVSVQLPCNSLSLNDLSIQFCELMKEAGDIGAAISKASGADSECAGRISPSERKRIEKELRDLISCAAGMLQQVAD